MEREKEKTCSCPENICIHVQENGKNHRFEPKNYWESQRYAFSGLKLILINERNFRIQVAIAVCVIAAGIFLRISHQDWVALFVVMAIVMVTEAFNSVIEAICDTVSKDFRINIRYAKDVSAGAVLVSAIVSIIAGVIIFSPYLWNLMIKLL